MITYNRIASSWKYNPIYQMYFRTVYAAANSTRLEFLYRIHVCYDPGTDIWRCAPGGIVLKKKSAQSVMMLTDLYLNERPGWRVEDIFIFPKDD